MIRFLLVLIGLIALVLAFGWYKIQSLPDWYETDNKAQEKVVNDLSNQISRQGVGGFLAGKFADVMDGKLQLNQTEFNALLLASLRNSRDGQRLLRVSDDVRATITKQHLEIGAVIDLDKLSVEDPDLGRKVRKLVHYLPLWEKSSVYIAVLGEPIARHGELAITENLSLKIGAIPVGNQVLRQLGVPLEEISRKSLPLRYLSVQDVQLSEQQIAMAVLPRF